MERKDFIRQLGLVTFGGAFLSVALQGCSPNVYNAKFTTGNKEITVLKSEFTYIENEKTVFRNFVLVKPETLAYPICVYRFSESEYSALLMSCTHKGCELHANKETLICPCHGSEFSNKGTVLNPPADLNLTTYKITVTNESILIHI